MTSSQQIGKQMFLTTFQATPLHLSGPNWKWSGLNYNQSHFRYVAKCRQINVLIGSDNPIFHHVLKEIHGNEAGDPITWFTNLGWVCFEPMLTEEFWHMSRSYFMCTYRSNHFKERETSDNILCKFWELKALGIWDEKAAVAQVMETLQFKDRWYEVGIPWKRGEPQLVNNWRPKKDC